MKKKSKRKFKKKSIFKYKIFKGFTLVELLAVIVILAVIMVIAIPSVLNTLETARKKTFVEYIEKVGSLGKQEYLTYQLSGSSVPTCLMYNIETDLDLSSTGDYHGYVLASNDDEVTHYYITLYDSEYMVYGVEYDSNITTDLLLDNADDSSEFLTSSYLAVVAGCSEYTNVYDNTTVASNSGEESSGSGSSSESGSSESSSSESGSSESSSSSSSENVVANKLALGDYVNYYPTNTSYTAYASNTGYTENSTLNPSELTSWRVLKINDDGTVDIVSTYVSSARSLGYDGQTLVLTNATALEQTTAPWTSNTTDNSNEALGGGDTLYLTDINQMSTADIPLKATTSSGSSQRYWLASRYYSYHSGTRWYFTGRCVIADGDIHNGNLYYHYNSSFYSYSSSRAFRPVLTLRSSVVISGGSGTAADPYTLSV